MTSVSKSGMKGCIAGIRDNIGVEFEQVIVAECRYLVNNLSPAHLGRNGLWCGDAWGGLGGEGLRGESGGGGGGSDFGAWNSDGGRAHAVQGRGPGQGVRGVRGGGRRSFLQGGAKRRLRDERNNDKRCESLLPAAGVFFFASLAVSSPPSPPSSCPQSPS